jgi:crotonobetainyl-CoA:carnitine CoA-transferase CaiB-like acyl-CoA transferase
MSFPLLGGARVLELSLLMPADHVGSILADLGAEVVKVEQPPGGDYVRELGGTLAPGISEFHLFYNRNKKSLGLNMRTEEGQKIFHQLVAQSDVVYESSTPGSREKLRADYESCRKTNPEIIYASFSPYGYVGPYSRLPSHGWGVFGFTGTSPVIDMGDGRLNKGENIVGFGDPGPMTCAAIIMAAINYKQRTGKGCRLDISMSDVLIYHQHSEAFRHLNNYPVHIPHRTKGRSNEVRFNFYRCKDGKAIAFQAVEKKFWDNFCRVVGREDWMNRGDWKIRIDFGGDDPELEAEMIPLFKTKTLAEWMKLLGEADVPVIPGYSLPEVLDDSHVVERKLISSYDHPGFGPVRQMAFPLLIDGEELEMSRPAPWAGQDNAAILAELGYTADEIAVFSEHGVIGSDPRRPEASAAVSSA